MVLCVATDFSGIEAPLVALNMLNIDVLHNFSSDICPNARRVIESRHSPRVLFSDVLKRNPKDLPNTLDVYVAGFPCPVFSSLSNVRGWHNNDRRPLRYFKECVKVLIKCTPKVFVLENVKAITYTRQGKDIAVSSLSSRSIAITTIISPHTC